MRDREEFDQNQDQGGYGNQGNQGQGQSGYDQNQDQDQDPGGYHNQDQGNYWTLVRRPHPVTDGKSSRRQPAGSSD